MFPVRVQAQNPNPYPIMCDYHPSLHEYSNEMAIAIQSDFRNSIHMINRHGFLERDLLYPKIEDTNIVDELERLVPLLLKTRGRDTMVNDFQKLKGNIVLLQYPDTSSWATQIHLQFFEVHEIDIDNNSVIFKLPDTKTTRQYKELGMNLLSYTSFNDFVYNTNYQVWIPSTMYLKMVDSYPGQKIKNDIGFLQYKLNPDTIRDCCLGSELFSHSQMYNNSIDFVKTP